MTGWKTFRPIVSSVGASLLLVGAGMAAEPAAEAALPDGFLEFLADWDNEQGDWQDPIEYEDPQWQVLDEQAGQSDE